MKLWLSLVLVVLSGCASVPKLGGRPQGTVLLISFDGFRSDYLTRPEAKNLRKFAKQGVQADQLKPIFPTLTFPNHYSIVTGLYPEHHGIVANDIYDPKTKARFTLRDPKSLLDTDWWEGEPLWVTVRKQGGISATMFWVGSFAMINGYRPNFWQEYDGKFPNADRVKKVLSWLELPRSERPNFITLYISDTDEVGHAVGPKHRDMNAAIKRVDDIFGTLIDGISARGLEHEIDILVVSDHGMGEVKKPMITSIEGLIKPEEADIVGSGTVIGVWPKAENEEALFQRLKKAVRPPNNVWRKKEIPPQFHYRDHRRIPPILLVAAPGGYLALAKDQTNPPHPFGAHGYDNSDPSMQGIFLARGPHIKAGARTRPVENVSLYQVMTTILKVKPNSNDGDASYVKQVLTVEASGGNPRSPSAEPSPEGAD